MTQVLLIALAVVAAIALIVGIARLSVWVSHRKSSADFKRERPDASSINDSSFGCGGGGD